MNQEKKVHRKRQNCREKIARTRKQNNKIHKQYSQRSKDDFSVQKFVLYLATVKSTNWAPVAVVGITPEREQADGRRREIWRSKSGERRRGMEMGKKKKEAAFVASLLP